MFEKVYQERLSSLNQKQRQAVETIDGPVMVIAGPGTGKTEILTLRIATIIHERQIYPSNVLALTFTEAAAQEMKHRLAKIIGPSAYQSAIFTFHGFCNWIIQNYAEYFPEHINASSLNELEQIEIIEDLLKSKSYEHITPFKKPDAYIKDIISAISELKKEGVTPETFSQAVLQQENDFQKIPDLLNEKGKYKGQMKTKYQQLQKRIARNKELLDVFKRYQDELLQRERYDFDDMLLEVIEKLRRHELLLRELQERFQYILIDEHQDTNAAQNAVIMQIAQYFNDPNLFVVGDEKQAIFRFQGASLENFLYFKQLYPDATLISLDENYRSHQTILDGSLSLITHNPDESFVLKDAIFLSAQSEIQQKEIEIYEAPDYLSEYQFITERIRGLMDQDVSGSDIAVIGRTNKDLATTAEFLDYQSIPYTFATNQNLLQDYEVRKFLQIIRMIAYPGNDAELVRALHVDSFKIHPLDIYTLVNEAKQNRTTVWKALANLSNTDHLYHEPDKLKQWYLTFIHWVNIDHNKPFDHIFIHILEESQLLAQAMSKPGLSMTLDRYKALYEEIKLIMQSKSALNCLTFIAYIDSLQKHNLALTASIRGLHKDSVQLMTAHKSKGLEFPYVFIVNAYDGHWGNKRKSGNKFTIPWSYLKTSYIDSLSEDNNEEERRLFFVAMTRAKKDIIITYARMGLDGKIQAPSQFIDEIHPDHRKAQISQSDVQPSLFQTITKSQPPTTNILFTEFKEYVRSLFFDRGISSTGLNNFLECPWKYIYRNLISIPEEQNEFQIYGTAMHACIHYYLTHSNREHITPDQLITHYSNLINSSIFEKELVERLMLKGTEILPLYLSRLRTLPDSIESEVFLRGFLSETISIQGKVDAIELTPKTHRCRLYDFKTGKPQSINAIEGRTKNSTGNYKRQITFYKLLIDQTKYKHLQVESGIIDFIEPDSRNQFIHHELFVSREETDALIASIHHLAESVTNLSFWDERCDDKDCKYCSLRDYMSDL